MRLEELSKLKKDSNSLYYFKNLIEKHSKGTVTATFYEEGYYDMSKGGEWVEGAEIVEEINPAAIVPMSFDDLKFLEGGTMSADNKKLYCYKALNKGTKITNTMLDESISTYTILQEANYSDFDRGIDDGLRIYILKRIDSNDKDN